jgi:hypothetical protein
VGVSVQKSERAARRLPASALPVMVELLAEGGSDSVSAAAALHFRGAKLESDGTEESDPTWIRVNSSGRDSHAA